MKEEKVQDILKLQHEARAGQAKGSKPKHLILMFGKMCLFMPMVQAFTSKDCMKQTNILESYTLLEPDACPVSD
jgi:hypothetical protein